MQVKVQLHDPIILSQRKKSGTDLGGGWMVSRTVLDVMEKARIPYPPACNIVTIQTSLSLLTIIN